MKTIQTEKIIYNGEERIKLIFDYDKELNSKIRILPDCRFIISNQDPLRIKIFKKQKSKPTLLHIPANRLWAI